MALYANIEESGGVHPFVCRGCALAFAKSTKNRRWKAVAIPVPSHIGEAVHADNSVCEHAQRDGSDDASATKVKSFEELQLVRLKDLLHDEDLLVDCDNATKSIASQFYAELIQGMPGTQSAAFIRKRAIKYGLLGLAALMLSIFAFMGGAVLSDQGMLLMAPSNLKVTSVLIATIFLAGLGIFGFARYSSLRRVAAALLQPSSAVVHDENLRFYLHHNVAAKAFLNHYFSGQQTTVAHLIFLQQTYAHLDAHQVGQMLQSFLDNRNKK